MPRQRTVLSILVWPSRSCTARRFPVRRRSALPWSGAGSECQTPLDQARCLPPSGKKASILAGCHRPIAPAAPIEQVLTRPLAGFLQEVVYGLPGLIRQLELDRSPGLLLPDGRTIDRTAMRSDIFDSQGDDVATTKLAVDHEVEKGKVAGLSIRSRVRTRLGWAAAEVWLRSAFPCSRVPSELW
jgi:hypothetical protein